MDKVIQPANPVQGIVLGQTASLDLEIGPRYHRLYIQAVAKGAAATTLTLADVIGLLTLKINGRPQRQHTANELNSIQSVYGAAYGYKAYDYVSNTLTWSAGVRVAPGANKTTIFLITMFFNEPWRKSYAAQEAYALYTSWKDGSRLRSLSLEIGVPNTGNLLANTSIAYNVWAETDEAVGPLDANNRPVTLMTKFDRLQVPYTAAGDLYITNLPKRDLCTQVSLFMPAAGTDEVLNVKVVKDSKIEREYPRIQNDMALLAGGMNEAALERYNTHVIFDHSDLPTDALVLDNARDYKLIATLSAAAAASPIITAISQLYGQID